MLVNALPTKLVNIRSTKMMKEISRSYQYGTLQNLTLVMAGLDPAIHVVLFQRQRRGCPGQARA
jgi:hypothetical protein